MIKRYLIVCLFVALALWLICPLKVGIVMGSSMAPALRDRQVILIHENYYRRHRPRLGDVVVLSMNGDTLVKRVGAVAGDRIWEIHDPNHGAYQMVKAGDVRRIQRALRYAPRFGTLRRVDIRPGYVYVLGDAGPSSYDSRTFGQVPIAHLEGRVIGLPRTD